MSEISKLRKPALYSKVVYPFLKGAIVDHYTRNILDKKDLLFFLFKAAILKNVIKF